LSDCTAAAIELFYWPVHSANVGFAYFPMSLVLSSLPVYFLAGGLPKYRVFFFDEDAYLNSVYNKLVNNHSFFLVILVPEFCLLHLSCGKASSSLCVGQ
jgi:hypothetical protein